VQGDGEQYDDGDEMTLHAQSLTAEGRRSKLPPQMSVEL
jgi:hypothetical protein